MRRGEWRWSGITSLDLGAYEAVPTRLPIHGNVIGTVALRPKGLAESYYQQLSLSCKLNL